MCLSLVNVCLCRSASIRTQRVLNVVFFFAGFFEPMHEYECLRQSAAWQREISIEMVKYTHCTHTLMTSINNGQNSSNEQWELPFFRIELHVLHSNHIHLTIHNMYMTLFITTQLYCYTRNECILMNDAAKHILNCRRRRCCCCCFVVFFTRFASFPLLCFYCISMIFVGPSVFFNEN